METMQAAVLVTPGRFEIREVPIPVIGPDDVLVRVDRCGVCAPMSIYSMDITLPTGCLSFRVMNLPEPLLVSVIMLPACKPGSASSPISISVVVTAISAAGTKS